MKKILIATFALSMMLGACKKEDVMKVTPEVGTKDAAGNNQNVGTSFKLSPNSKYTVQNGRPVFASVDDFVQTGTSISAKTKVELLADWSSTCGYSTLLKKSTEQSFWENVPANITTLAKSGVEDNVYAAILNDQGEIQLGDSIIKVIGDKEFIYHTNNTNAVSASANAQANGTIENLSDQLQEFVGVRVRNTLVLLDPAVGGELQRGGCPFYNLFVKTVNFNANQRSYFKLANRSYFLHATMNIQVDMERKLTGWFGIPAGWGHTNVTTSKVYDYYINYKAHGGRGGACGTRASGIGTVDPRLPITFLPVSRNDASQLDENIDRMWGINMWFDMRYAQAHFSNTYNGVTHTHLIDFCDSKNWCL